MTIHNGKVRLPVRSLFTLFQLFLLNVPTTYPTAGDLAQRRLAYNQNRTLWG
ncbi:hypothetical protein [Fibrella forsythiae]|uniref:Transposase n=1 Tax=Fibrella forsythiae TaxID=2817061 RepID=A0ABS3JS04_9BACT|nr:hypothetical protein [Fibrella forsythiae]MBO0952156.1 hypothetical protein [Fibrella forsythiae]